MSDDEINSTVKLLGKLKPGFLPYPIFEQIARLVTLPIIEFVPLRASGKEVEVLLLRRPTDDPIWPGLFHTPGTVIRATDVHSEGSNWPAFDRIMQDELLNTDLGQPHYVGSIFHQSKRGTEQAQVFWVEVIGEPKIGEFHPASNLPTEFLDSQQGFVEQAVQNYLTQF